VNPHECAAEDPVSARGPDGEARPWEQETAPQSASTKRAAYERLLQSDVTAAGCVLKPRSGPRPTYVICHIATTISKRRWRRLAVIGESSLLVIWHDDMTTAVCGVWQISFVGCSLSPILSLRILMVTARLVQPKVNRHPSLFVNTSVDFGRQVKVQAACPNKDCVTRARVL